MNFDQVCEIVKMNGFPIDKINDITNNTDIYYDKLSVRDTENKIKPDHYTKLRMLNIINSSTSHQSDYLGKKVKHDCTQSNWSTKVEGWPVDYNYKFCSKCRKELDKKAIVFDNAENICRIINFE